MAAVAEEAPVSQEYIRDRALRALQVAAVSGFYSESALSESCLGLCNVCREGMPWECMRIEQAVGPSLWPVFLPNARKGWNNQGERTRVLPPRRLRKVVWTFEAMDEDDVKEVEAAIRPANTSDEDGVRQQGEEDAEEALDASGCLGLGMANLRRVQWPEGVKEVQLLRFDRSIEGVPWPSSLERLSFHALRSSYSNVWTTRGFMEYQYLSTQGLFDRPLDGASFPSGLREIFLGERFDRPLGGVVWPHGLERLSLPGYRQPIDNVGWPPALKSLEFMLPEEIRARKAPDVHAEDLDFSRTGFNCRFTTLPASLETLWLSDGFEQSLEGVVWPSGLSTLGLGMSFTSDLMSSVSWPSSLRKLYTICSMDEAERPPAGCTVTVVRAYDTESQSFDFDHEDGLFGDMDEMHDYISPYGAVGDDFYEEPYFDDFEEQFIL